MSHKPKHIVGDRGSTVVKALRYKSERSQVRFQMVSLEFFIDIKSFRSLYGPVGSTQPLTEMSIRSISW